jgi:hypothetical protein
MLARNDPVQDEITNLMDTFCRIDPDGMWDDDEWEAYVQEHGSDKLKRYIKRKGKDWFWGKKGEIDDENTPTIRDICLYGDD